MSKKQKYHDLLKLHARNFLNELGFEDDEIHEEYMIKSKEMRHNIRVDLAGISKETDDYDKPKRIVAIECGSVQAEKISWLNLFFDEVILLPHMKDRISHSFHKEEAFMEIKKLKRELKEEQKTRINLSNKNTILKREVKEKKNQLIIKIISDIIENFGYNNRINFLFSDINTELQKRERLRREVEG